MDAMFTSAQAQHRTAHPPEIAASHPPLTAYVLRGLKNCWMPDLRRWSHRYHLDGRPQPNESVPYSDVFYSLNVLLGLSRVPNRQVLDYDLDEIFDVNTRQLLKLPVKTYAYGMALWTSAAMERPLPAEVSEAIHGRFSDRRNWASLRGQDLGMVLTGLCAVADKGDTRSRELAKPLFEFLVSKFSSQSGLFFDEAQGLRKSFASFATQTYLTIACYAYFELSGDKRALKLANSCVKKLISLQGPRGEWPWFYHVPSGRVVDFYEVYSVHQDGMAPAFLEYAERHGVPEAASARLRGFNWIFGENQLGVSMLKPEVGMILRSQVRKGELENKLPRIMRSVFRATAGRSSRVEDAVQLVIRRECRSYHLGWMLWAFAGRQDLPEITCAQQFSDPR